MRIAVLPVARPRRSLPSSSWSPLPIYLNKSAYGKWDCFFLPGKELFREQKALIYHIYNKQTKPNQTTTKRRAPAQGVSQLAKHTHTFPPSKKRTPQCPKARYLYIRKTQQPTNDRHRHPPAPAPKTHTSLPPPQPPTPPHPHSFLPRGRRARRPPRSQGKKTAGERQGVRG